MLLIVVCLTALTSCRPRGVLSSAKMQDVLYDLHRTEAILQLAGYNYGHDEAAAKYYYEVFRKHGITQAQFDSSLVWYTDNPELFNKIYPKLVARYDAEIEAEKALYASADSASLAKDSIAAMMESIGPASLDDILQQVCNGWPLAWYKEPEPVALCTDSIWQQMQVQKQEKLAADSLKIALSAKKDTINAEKCEKFTKKFAHIKKKL